MEKKKITAMEKKKNYCYGEEEKMTDQICNPAGLPEPGEEGSVHGGGIVADGVLSAEEDAGRVLHHVVPLARVPGDHRRRQVVIVVPRRACHIIELHI